MRASAAVAPLGSASSSAAPVAEAPSKLEPFDATRVHRLLEEPRFSEASTLVASGKLLDAARSVEASALADDRALAAYVSGRLRAQGGDPKGAALAFDRAAADEGPLRAFALLTAGELLETLGDHRGALERAEKVNPREVPPLRLELLLARSDAHSGKLAEGFEHYRNAIKGRPKGWVSTALELGRALIAHPGAGNALEAAKLGLTIELDAPSGKGGEEAKKIGVLARGALGKDERSALENDPAFSPEERARRWVAAGLGKRALPLLDRLAKKKTLGCGGVVAHAEALTQVKRHSEASAEYGRAIDICEKSPAERDLAAVLFAAGRAAAKGGQLKLARTRFKRIEDVFATHRLADDARLEGARAALEDGDTAAFDGMLGSIADDYPDGDMRGDGLFALGLAHALRGDFAGALPAFQRGEALPRERAYERAGRFRYFAARALFETGKTDQARAAYAEVIREVPCGYYMALAYSRLDAIEKGASKRALDQAVAAATSPENGVSPEILSSAAWKTALALVEADDPLAAEAALSLLGVSDRTASPETLWAAARLLARSSDSIVAHRLLRSAFEIEPRPGRNEAYAFRDAYPSGDARLAWDIAYPKPFANLVTHASTESSVPEALIDAVMREESAFDPNALSKASAVGLLQLIPITAHKMAGPLRLASDDKALRDPAVNLRLGARYLASIRHYFADDPLLAIPGYNAGRGAPDAWTRDDPNRDFDLFVESIPYPETKAYTKRVIASLCAYEILSGETDRSDALHIPKAVRPGP